MLLIVIRKQCYTINHIMQTLPQILLVTTGFEKEAEAEACLMYLLENKIVACGHIFRERSAYYWDGALHKGDEWMLSVKTLDCLWENVQDAIRSIHSYDLPMIIGNTIEHVLPEYAEWVREVCVLKTNG